MKRVKKLIVFMLALVMTFGIANAQSKSSPGGGKNTVLSTGLVSDESGEPLIGATIMETGTQNGTMTDIDGKFSIYTKPGATLTISYVGFAPQEVKVGTDLNITLRGVANSLEDVVVIGYGTVKKKDATGAVTQVKADALSSENPASVQDLLRNVAGLNVGITNNAKNSGASMSIRGTNSLSAGNDILKIVDGMIFYGELSEINPDDIQQLDVLKDASAAAVYGAQAANGVIIITTKKGKIGKPTVNLTANFGFTERAGFQHYFTPEEYINHKQIFFEAETYGFDANGNYTTYQSSYTDTPGYFSNPNNLPAGVTLDQWRGYTTQEGQSDQEIWLRRLNFKGDLLANALAGNSTDWEKLIYQTGFQQDYNLSVSGGSEKAHYYLSAGFLHNDGIVKGDYYKSIRASLNVDMEVTNWLKIGATVRFQDRSDDAKPVSTGLIQNSPFGHAYDEDGSPSRFVLGPQSDYSIMGDASLYDLQWDKLEQGYTTFDTKAFAQITLPYGFTYTFNFAPRYQFYYKREWIDSSKPDRKAEDSGANRDMAKRFDWSLNNIINWNHKYGLNDITVTLVQEAEERRYWSEGIGARNITPTDALGFHFIESASGNVYSNFWSTDTHSTADGLLARAQYNFDERYLFTASIRRDGYSFFGQNNQHAYFPAVAAGWVFSNEKFWGPLSKVMNYGKLRVSWGQNGNRDIGDYIALANLVTGGSNRAMYFVGDNLNPELLSYLRVDRLANPNLQWEKTASLNFGLDFGFINNRISGNLDVYFKQTKDMIMAQRLPGFSGYSSITTNLGQVNNSGVELTLNTINMDLPNFVWNTDFTLTYNNNKIKHLLGDLDENGNEVDMASNNWFIDHAIDEIWDFKVEGIWQISEAEEAAKYGQRPGDIKVWNNPDNDIVNPDGSITYVYDNDDKVFLGHRTAPWRMTMRNQFTIFKSFEVALDLYGLFGYKDYQDGIETGDIIANNDNGGGFLLYAMRNQAAKDIWTPWNQLKDAGRIAAVGPTGAEKPHYFVDRSFVRFSNLSIGYYFPHKIIDAIKASELKLYFNVNNLGTIHGKAWKPAYGDPENHSYTTRTFTIGVNLKF